MFLPHFYLYFKYFLPSVSSRIFICCMAIRFNLIRRSASWTHRKCIRTSFSQKGIEFDPFEIWVVQLLPKSKIF